MLYPHHIDGCSLVVLRQKTFGFSIVESGRLEYDGESLRLVRENSSRIITDAELSAFMLVRTDSKIAAYQGFDLFLIVE